MKSGKIGDLSIPFFLATAGISGIAISSRIMGMIDASPEFYSLYKMSSLSIAAFVISLCIVVPIALGLVAYSMARLRLLRPILPVYCVVLSTLALTGLVRDWPAPAGGWLLIGLSLVCAVVGFFAFMRIGILRVFLMATALGLPVSAYKSISIASAAGEQAAIDVPVPARADPTKPLPNILFIIFDELPLTTLLDAAGNDIDKVRFPNIYNLVHHAYWFANAGSVSCNTPTAVPGILTGRLFGSPPKSLPPDFKSHPVNLFSLLKTEYNLNVVQNLTQMCPPGTCNHGLAFYQRKFFYEHVGVAWLVASLPKAFESSLPNLDSYWMEAGAEAGKLDHRKRFSIRVSQIEGFIDSVGMPADKPTLDFAHFLIPHTPFDLLPNGQQYFEGFTTYAITGNRWDDDQRPHVLQNYYRHILQSGYADKVVGQLVSKLKADGRYDDTIIAIVADHGVSFVPGDTRRVIDDKNFANLMGVPMIIKAANQDAGVRVDAPAQTIDLLPTLLGSAGLRVERSQFHGRDLLDPSSPLLEKRSNFCAGKDYRSFELQLEEPMRREVAVRNAIFGTREDRVLEMGYSPRPDWIGKPLSARGDVKSGKGVARLGHVLGKSRDGLVPLYLNGVLKNAGISDDNLLLVATLNDKIAAVMPTVRARNGATNVISVMLQPALLKEGTNSIALYALDRTLAGRPSFMSLTIKDIDSGETAKAIDFDYSANE